MLTDKEIATNGANYISDKLVEEAIVKAYSNEVNKQMGLMAKRQYDKAIKKRDENEIVLNHNERMREKRHKAECIEMCMIGIKNKIRYYYKHEHRLLMAFKYNRKRGYSVSPVMFERLKSIGVFN